MRLCLCKDHVCPTIKIRVEVRKCWCLQRGSWLMKYSVIILVRHAREWAGAAGREVWEGLTSKENLFLGGHQVLQVVRTWCSSWWTDRQILAHGTKWSLEIVELGHHSTALVMIILGFSRKFNIKVKVGCRTVHARVFFWCCDGELGAGWALGSLTLGKVEGLQNTWRNIWSQFCPFQPSFVLWGLKLSWVHWSPGRSEVLFHLAPGSFLI